MIDRLLELMTPEEVLAKTEFDQAFPILPERFPTFDDLIVWRQQIRDLIILPVKNDELRAYYNGLDKKVLAQEVHSLLRDSRFLIAANKFPYLAPENTAQFIVWVKDSQESRENVAEFIKTVVIEREIDLDDLILFERPANTRTKLVKGTFPAIRHIHLWTRAK